MWWKKGKVEEEETEKDSEEEGISENT